MLPTLKIIVRATVSRDAFGQGILGTAFHELCAPVVLNFLIQGTTVRTDSSSTHGHAEEAAPNVVILVRASSQADVDKQVNIGGHLLRVISKHPRYTVGGKLDHHELRCVTWA